MVASNWASHRVRRTVAAVGQLPTAARWALLAALAALVSARIAGAFTEAFNWDELSFMHRVERSIAQGKLIGGGRPGLAIVPLWPLVEGCRDEVAVLRAARLLWGGVTVAYVVGIFALLRDLLRLLGSPRPGHAALFGAALTCLTPVFWRWSLQIRTDQLALAAAAWGSFFLLRSRQRLPWAALAGLACGLGFLATQKAAYIAALGGALAAVDVLTQRPRPWRQAFARAGTALGVFGAVLAAFYLATTSFDKAESFGGTVRKGLGSLSDYGDLFGRGTYLAILERQPVHVLWVALLCVATVASLRCGREGARSLPYAWVTLLLGLAVALFHRSSFAYFWMTLAMFPAVAIALGMDSIVALVPSPRTRAALLGGSWIALVLLFAPGFGQTLTDTQAVQRDSYAFVQRSFSPQDQGWQLEGGLFCHAPETPMPVLMYVHVLHHFQQARREESVRWVQDELRRRPIKYIMGAHTLVMLPFPEELKRFWGERYVPYYKAVMLPGRALGGRAGTQTQFDVLVPGAYVWRGSPPPRLEIDGKPVNLASPVTLDVGSHSIRLLADTPPGALVWKVDTPPQPDPNLEFFNAWQQAEIALVEEEKR